MNFHSTGEVAKKLNISVRTIRYYDQIGLMMPSEKRENGKRLYSDQDLITLEKITLLKKLNLSLNDIEKVLSKITIEQLLYAHKKSLQQELNELNNAINSTNTILNMIHLEGNLNWELLLPLIHKKKTADKNWNHYFDQQEKQLLKERLPKLEQDTNEVRHWINLNKRIELCLERGVTPESEEGQMLAEEALFLSNELFKRNEELAEKFYEIRMSPEKSRNINLYPVKVEVLQFLEEAIHSFTESRK